MLDERGKVMDLNAMGDVVHEIAVDKGWYEYEKMPSIPELLCLIHSEVSEALEVWRNKNDERIGEELADIVIRVMDMACHLDIDLQSKVDTKIDKNRERPWRHGGKRC